tara:strand:- start:49 stop:291 length:243 start_codon:yes stop_codon:yes gene_type:complete
MQYRVTRKNDKKQSLFESKQDVIEWLEYLLYHQDLSIRECAVAPSDKDKVNQTFVNVFVDHVIRQRYEEMIAWLKSEEVA